MKKVMLLLLLAGPCFAKVNVSILAGGAFPTGKLEVSGAGDDDTGGGGGAVGGQIMVPIDQTWSAGFDVLANDLGKRSTGKLLAPAPGTTEYQVRTLTLLAGARAQSKAMIADLQPYLFGGVGLHRTNTWADVSPNAGFVWADTGTTEKRRALDDTKTGFAAAVAIGADAKISPSVSLGLEGRYSYLAKSTFQSRSISAFLPAGTDVKIDPSSFDVLARLTLHF